MNTQLVRYYDILGIPHWLVDSHGTLMSQMGVVVRSELDRVLSFQSGTQKMGGQNQSLYLIDTQLETLLFVPKQDLQLSF